MNNLQKSSFQDKTLRLAFGVLIILSLGIGIVGISQIQVLSQKTENLVRRNLQLEKAVLEMRINNTTYAMGVRNYIFWRISHYINSASAAANLNNIFEANKSFLEQLKLYKDSAYLPQQKDWAIQVNNSFTELAVLGKQIIKMADRIQTGNSEKEIDSILVSFENRLYRIDDFLDNTMGKENLNEIERQMAEVRLDKQRTVFFLSLILLIVITIGILISRVVSRRLLRERIQRDGLFNQMINVEEKERKNLSNAIHDQIGQDLSALKIYLGLFEQGIKDAPQELKDKLKKAKEITSKLIEKSHNIAFLLRPPDLDEVGLVESLEALLLEYKHLASVNYTYEKPKEELHLSSEHSLVIYRIAQELLNNMVKHAKANKVEIRLTQNKDTLGFFYEDNGLGFIYDEIQNQPRRRKDDNPKLGFLSLKERVSLLDGEMSIDSSPGKGTRIFVSLPIT